MGLVKGRFSKEKGGGGGGGGVETDLRKRRLKTRGRMGREKVHTREREKL